MIVTEEYSNAYSEVLEILKYVSEEDYEKIPKNIINLFETNGNKNYKFKYDTNKTLSEQNVSKKAKTIIAILFRDYWATEEQKEKILKKENYDRSVIEQIKREKYNPDNLFKNVQYYKLEKSTNLPVEIKKKNLFEKLIDFIKKLIKRI